MYKLELRYSRTPVQVAAATIPTESATRLGLKGGGNQSESHKFYGIQADTNAQEAGKATQPHPVGFGPITST